MIKGILFDFDGVIADTEPLHYKTFKETLRPFNIKIEEKRWYREFTGTGSQYIMTTLFKENNIQEDVQKWIAKRKTRLWKYLETEEIVLKQGLMDFLELLEKRKIKKAIASGSGEDMINFVLKKTGIADYFEAICGSESITQKKPNPEVFLLSAKKLGLKPEQCLVIEDSENGINAAKNAGIPYICMESPVTQELKACPLIIKNYKEFPIELLED